MTRTVRGAFVVAVAGLASIASIPVALAFDLEDYLEAAAEADYAGSQVVIARWDGESLVAVIEVEHAGSLTMLQGGRVVDAGKVFADGSAGSIVVSAWKRYASDRYSASDPVAARRLGRDAESVAILEDDGAVRAKIVFDEETGAALTTEIYDGDGRLFRLSTMMQFDSTPWKAYAIDKSDEGISDVLLSIDTTKLPDDAAGYRLADMYSGPDDVVQAFYTDGLFSFSLFELERQAEQFEDAVGFEIDGRDYKRLATATDVWVSWQAGGSTYLLVGDLPPDHLEEVLVELPQPSALNIFRRFWRGIFG
ncbi:MAG TPA: hypothetical protein VGC47_13300 [Acidimicrobiia bacterium]|jgi:hypothetical protein